VKSTKVLSIIALIAMMCALQSAAAISVGGTSGDEIMKGLQNGLFPNHNNAERVVTGAQELGGYTARANGNGVKVLKLGKKANPDYDRVKTNAEGRIAQSQVLIDTSENEKDWGGPGAMESATSANARAQNSNAGSMDTPLTEQARDRFEEETHAGQGEFGRGRMSFGPFTGIIRELMPL